MINRRMILVSDGQNTGQHRVITSSGGNTILDGKTQTVYTTSDKTTHFMSPIGSLQLTAEECNEILMKRAVAAVQNQQAITTTASDSHSAPISIQVQKVLQTLEDSDEQQLTHCKMEPNMSSSPKLETIEIVHFETAEDTKPIIHKTRKNDPGSSKERPYACEQCGKTFLLKHHLTTHARSHTGERPHVCPHCGKDFSHKHCLNTHLLLHTTERPYQCGECKKCFTLKHHLLTHLRVHTRDRPFVCQECGRSFPLKRHLVTHSKFHAGERPYICDDCGESFSQKEHLDMHSRFHGSVNPFACNDCGATFARKFQLINHGKLHGRVPHSCTVCGREFLQKRTLATHMKTHTGEASFPCLACGEGYASKAELNAHNRLVHGGLNPNAPNTTIVTNKTATVIQQQQSQAQQNAAQQAAHHQQAQQQAAAQQQAQQQAAAQQAAAVQAQQQQQQQQIEVQHIQQQQQPQTVTVVGNPNILTATISGETPPRLQYACRECGSVFNSREGLALHLRLHSGDKSLINDLCALTASIPGHLFQGVNQINLPTGTTFVTTPGASSSPVPVQIITSTGEVVNQILQSPTHTTQQHQQIQIQAQPQQQTAQVKQHIVQQQAVQVQQQPQQNQAQQQVQQATVVQITSPPQQKAKTHFCQFCGKSFVAKHGLMLHNKRHPDGSCTLRSHVCPECGKAFLQKNHLILHQRQHLEQNRGGKSNQQQQIEGQAQAQTQQNGDQLAQQGQQQITIQQSAQGQAQQAGQQIQLATRNVLMSNQPVLQVLPDGGTWVKYEIIQSDPME
ncbi:hypothetical protein PVAND_008281 [Polypedilum vanderplanki]|uniref:C2H2-type domain-containing protein n=1 Tax=Polypedilum vanderplanki TaxID=319348 RepID=A0A9J6C960_POLVA|nr:hypothetical protein PVAND_008281 [Polypedilum vanderplanki]